MLASAKVMDALKSIGLNLYERRLWVALLARGTSTAGELSEIANVPRSRTYDILQSLADKGFVVIQTSKPIRYVAMSPKEALERSKKKMEEDFQLMQDRIDELKKSPVMKELETFHTKGIKMISAADMTGALKGNSVSQQLNSMIREANKNLNIVTTAEGLNLLAKSHLDLLKKASERGVSIKIATTPSEKPSAAIEALNSIAEIRAMDKKEVPISGRFFVADGKEMILSLTDSKNVHSTQDMALWSKSEHAAGNMLNPLFNLVWSRSKPVK